ncbi:MAG: hypothetical protein EOO65_05720, partial [Methanosarcinales archaeon]
MNAMAADAQRVEALTTSAHCVNKIALSEFTLTAQNCVPELEFLRRGEIGGGGNYRAPISVNDEERFAYVDVVGRTYFGARVEWDTLDVTVFDWGTYHRMDAGRFYDAKNQLVALMYLDYASYLLLIIDAQTSHGAGPAARRTGACGVFDASYRRILTYDRRIISTIDGQVQFVRQEITVWPSIDDPLLGLVRNDNIGPHPPDAVAWDEPHHRIYTVMPDVGVLQ